MESSKRKPLSDITNKYNLTPTPVLRKLVAASSTSNLCSKPPISISKSNSSSRKFFSESSSRSNTSIGSSNVGATLNSKKTVRFQSSRPSICSTISPGKQRDIDNGITGNSPCSLNNTNDGREGILKHSSSSTVKIIETGQECPNPSAFFVDSAKDKGRPINSSHEKTREKGKAAVQPSDIVEIIESAKERGNPLKTSNSLHEKTREKGKTILQPSDMDQITESAKDISKPLNAFSSSHEKTREKGKVVLQPSNVAEIIESSKDKGKTNNTFNTSHEKTKEKGKENLQHSNIVQVAEHKGSSDAVKVLKSRPPRRKSQRTNFDAGASSCPPVMRPKSMQNDLGEFGDVKCSKSWTDLRPKRRKRTSARTENTCALPPEFIEQQNAYFKEVDAFELLEEEADPDDLD